MNINASEVNGTHLTAMKNEIMPLRAVARRSFAPLHHLTKDCFAPRKKGRNKMLLMWTLLGC